MITISKRLWTSIIVFSALITGCDSGKESNINIESTPKATMEISEDTPSSFFPLSVGTKYSLISDVQVGESLEIIKENGNSYLAAGEYSSSLKFFRLYRMDNEGVNIYYETTSEDLEFTAMEELIAMDKVEDIFNMKPNQEMFILKTPYQIGNEWGYGEIISINNDSIVVRYENGIETTFRRNVGIIMNSYPIPPELKGSFEQSEFTAERTEG